MIDTIILHFGYVEGARLSALICTLEEQVDFSSAEEAMLSLSKELLSKYKQDFPNDFCTKCGQTLKKLYLDLNQFKDWLVSLLSMDIDALGGEQGNWLIGDSPSCLLGKNPEEVHVVESSAEDVILNVLGLIND